jgi:two-component sensor histidine kinase
MHEHAAKILDTADLVLDRVAEHVEGMDAARLAAPETSAFLRRVRQPYEQFVSIWIADAEGYIRAGSQAWDPARSIADREFFHVHRERPDAGTFVSAAFTGRATTMASFAVSRRRSDAAGGFAGSIHVALSPDYFARFYAEAAPPFAHAAGLFRNDGAILARHPVLTDGHGRLGPGSPLLRHMAAGAERGVIGTPSSLDGQPRLYAFQKVGAWPVYVGFGADRAALLARWHGNLRAYGVVALAAALTLLLREVDGRIGALAQALALLSTTQWHGVELAELARGELAPFLGAPRSGGPRAELEGPAVTIAATAVQPLAMALHELATNATKYGALSRPEGLLTLRWEFVEGPGARLRLTWQERGGPPVEQPPTDSGFGARVLQATVARQLGGRLALRWDRAGLTCEMDLSAARILVGRLDTRAA